MDDDFQNQQKQQRELITKSFKAFSYIWSAAWAFFFYTAWKSDLYCYTIEHHIDGLHDYYEYSDRDLGPDWYNTGDNFKSWFFWGFTVHAAMGFFPVIQIQNYFRDSNNEKVEKSSCYAIWMLFGKGPLLFFNFIWYVKGMNLLWWGLVAPGCFDNGYLLKAKNLMSWFYSFTLPVNVLALAFCCYSCCCASK